MDKSRLVIRRTALLSCFAALALTEPAFAGAAVVPGPLLGAGLPALMVIGGAYWLFRRFRRD